ncbi:hypothetical protein [Chroococcidiopsis sp. CCALA 051]|nr:hypothetical protein [Chroococcidiopsis sp. CCALA 051]
MAKPFSLTEIDASLFNNCKLNTSAFCGDRGQKTLKLLYLFLERFHTLC